MKIRINSYLPITNVEGPNDRFCIWVQGCSIRCQGCANSHMWDKNLGIEYDTSDMINLIKLYKDKIEGVTFLGGEPTEQIEAVTEISKAVQKMGLSVLLFTGYEYKSLKDNEEFKKLIKHIDILIDGKYIENQQDYSRPWVGSSNQNYYFFSDRYNESILSEYKNKIEIRINPENKITLSGMGNFSKLIELMR